MAANALPAPRQLRLPMDAPTFSRFDVIRLAWHINRLHFGDALVSGMWRLERQHFEQIASVENDSAEDGTLVTGSYVEYVVFVAGRLSAAVETRADDGVKVADLHARLAGYLLAGGWQVTGTRLVVSGALASPGMRLDRVKRLLKGE